MKQFVKEIGSAVEKQWHTYVYTSKKKFNILFNLRLPNVNISNNDFRKQISFMRGDDGYLLHF